MFQIGDHTGTYSTYWGHACHVDGHMGENQLPSCQSCHQQKLSQASHGNYKKTLDDISMKCSHGKCSSWNVMDDSFHFPLPKGYPTTFDVRLGSPIAPTGREVTGNKRSANHLLDDDIPNEKKLCSVPLSIPWLKEAIILSHYNMKTQPPNATHKNKRFWTKKHIKSILENVWCEQSAD
jgi:hypothetical protein